jgi:hypothetical protein
MSVMGRAWRLARYVWAAPCTAVGLLIALPAIVAGARVARVDGVLEVTVARQGKPPGRWLRALPFCAITFGHVVIGVHRHELGRLRAHEHAHVRQYERWGALFLLAYPASSLVQWLRGGSAYKDNRFEVQARREASGVRDGA